MKTLAVRAALLAAVFATASMWTAPAAAASSKGIAASKDVYKILVQVQDAYQKGDMATAMSEIKQAQAISTRTPADDYLINQYLGIISGKQNDLATADTAFEAMADSPLLDEDPNKSATLSNAFKLALNAQHYQKAIKYGEALNAITPLNAEDLGQMALAYYNIGDKAHAKEFAQKAIDASKAAGAPPDRAALQIIMNTQLEAHDEAGALATLESLAFTGFDSKDIGEVLSQVLTTKGITDTDVIFLGRLADFSDATWNDYPTVADTLMRHGYPGEARALLQRHNVDPGLLATARTKAAADEKTLPGLIAGGAKGGPDYNAKLAEALYGYGRYSEAEAAARRGEGGKDHTEAQMVLGMALAQQGKYADAVATFQAVNDGPARNKIAHYWIVIVQHKMAPAPAASH